DREFHRPLGIHVELHGDRRSRCLGYRPLAGPRRRHRLPANDRIGQEPTIRSRGETTGSALAPSSAVKAANVMCAGLGARKCNRVPRMHFDVELFLQYIVIGLANGALIALIALGYTLVYGIVELINFAHGEVFMMGAFFAFTIISATAVTSTSSFVAILGVALLGLF